MNTIELPDAEPSSYTAPFSMKIEEELKTALEEAKAHTKKQLRPKDLNEAIRIQIRKIVAEYWSQNLEKSA